MTRNDRARPILATLVLVLSSGCKGGDGGAADGDTGTDSAPTTLSTSDTHEETSGLDGDDDDPVDPAGECLLWEIKDCADGQKCMPWSDTPDRLPDAYRCCAEVGNDVVGDGCTIAEYDGSCLDSCALGSMCVLDDPDNLGGVCRAFCNPSSPSACGSDQTCKSFFEALPLVPNVPLCMDRCDPLVQDCPSDTWKCIPDTPTESGQSGFICVPPPPGSEKALFDPCALANDCGKGLVCLSQDRVPGCTFASCCSAFCSLAEGDSECKALHPDMQCIDWMSPDPQWSDVGACAIPS